MPNPIEPYGRTQDGQDVHRIVLEHGIRVTILTIGAVIETLTLPSRQGPPTNIALGLGNLDDYRTRSPHFGAVAGRFANRIAGARFTLDGVEHRLTPNDGPNALHGGPQGFGKRIWTIADATSHQVTLAYTSPHGEEGYPGTLQTRVTYTVDNTTLRIHYAAETDRPTVLNLTNHSYFNLVGEGSGDIMDHLVQIEADSFLPADAAGIPTGEIRSVANTPFDFRTPQTIGSRIRTADEQILFGRGYDRCFVLRDPNSIPDIHRAATVTHPPTGRTMQVWTDQPGLQLYSGNMLTGALAGPSNRAYRPGDALCLETQHYPDSPNHPHFPSTTLRPGQTFQSTTEYRFPLT